MSPTVVGFAWLAFVGVSPFVACRVFLGRPAPKPEGGWLRYFAAKARGGER